jgi:N-methylhydantoinase A
MRLDRDAAEEAIRRHIAEPLGLDVVEAAAGIKRIVDAKMADTLREVTIGRGHDPRDFVLYAYGGAGPMHCAGYGAESGVRRIVVPATSMVHSAYGALASDVQHTAQRSILVGAGGESPWEALDGPAIERDLHELEERCLAALEESGVPRASVEISRSADMRYRRQTHDLIVALEDGPVDGDSLRTLIEGFERTYEARYGRGSAFREAGIELTTLRVTAVGRTARPRLGETIAGDVQASGNGHRPVRASRPVYDVAAGRHLDTAVVPWQEIGEGERLEGPLIVEHPETTVLVPRGFTASTDPYGNLFLDATEAS